MDFVNKIRICCVSFIQQLMLTWRNFGCKIIIPGCAIGDIVFVAIIVREYKRRCPTARFCLVVDGAKRGDCDAAKLFADLFEHIETNLPVVLRHMAFPTVYKLWPHIWSVMCPRYGSVNLLDLTAQLLKCPFELKRTRPCYLSKPQYAFDGHVYPQGETVLLCPDATSAVLPNATEVWLAVARHLNHRGLKVVFNAKDGTRWNGYESVFYDVEKTCAFAEHCGYVVAMRSGMTDLMAYITHAKILAVYSRNLDDWLWTVSSAWKKAGYHSATDDFIRYWSLSGLIERKGLYDCFYDGENDLLCKIDGFLNGKTVELYKTKG